MACWRIAPLASPACGPDFNPLPARIPCAVFRRPAGRLLSPMPLAVVFLLAAAAASPARAQAPDSLLTRLLTPDFPSPPYVTVLHLIAHPERYHERTVVVSGYLHHRHEDHALYLSKEDADYGVRANAIALAYADSCYVHLLAQPEPMPCSRETGNDEADGRHVTIEGQFFAVRGDHFQTMYGSIPRVARVTELRRWYDGRDALWERSKDGTLRRTRD